ncbi:S66 peptidase family protein [Sphingobacterium hungaricum]|uniref:LD-carboxypeptidase n=1 Tax=Sphingobacterium hungaricum TaxID=2082723 RepID=A0A928UVD0_9SPHI|nr:LD-carboxypeptidase [Sphingobacterium hungaricum]MBE8713407.1 LD-carboxypeptidase [Sphingobacterium hungaricum]
MKRPSGLQKGDKVAIVCPASFVRGTVDIAVKTLESWGLEVQIGKTVTSAYHQFAGDDALRAKDLQDALDDDSVKAVFAGRGGYGTVRIIDAIDFSNFKKNPKWLIGFSDITVLHSHVERNLAIPTIHGQMPKSFEESTKSGLNTLKTALFGKPLAYSFKQNKQENREGKVEGILIGGNLAILHSILASDSDMVYDNKILFIEDVGESFYNIDRMLWTLKRAGKLAKLKGLLVGSFSSMKDATPGFGQTVEEIILDKVKGYDYPVAFHFPAGHIDNNHALILGAEVRMEVGKSHVNLEFNS